jgi:hypothetical protein
LQTLRFAAAVRTARRDATAGRIIAETAAPHASAARRPDERRA